MASGPLCVECDQLKQSHPLMTVEDFLLAYRQSPALRKSIEASRIHLQEAAPNFKVPSAVSSLCHVGTRVEFAYAIFTADEFLKHFKVSHEDVDLKTMEVMNEQNQPETVIAVRDNTVPRKLVVYCDLGNTLSQDMMPNEIREGQGCDKHTALCSADISTRDRLLLPGNRFAAPTLAQLHLDVDKIINERTQRGLSDQLRTGGPALGGLASQMQNSHGIQLQWFGLIWWLFAVPICRFTHLRPHLD